MDRWEIPYLPKPRDLFRCFGVISVNSIALPIIHIDFLHAAKHQLEKKDYMPPNLNSKTDL